MIYLKIDMVLANGEGIANFRNVHYQVFPEGASGYCALLVKLDKFTK